MIPVELKVRNFLSYGATVQTINFEPFRLICLSGKNGHGKSALLDAITWALWGQARKTSATSKADEGLVRLGQHHMMVSFDFLYNAKRYRVQREFVLHNNKSSTELNFGIVNEQGLCTTLNEKSTRATQQKIIEVLGLDYESCINSIFLRQGQSNEFSQKSAQDRKEILATILNMQHYETLKTKAQEKAREHANAAQQLVPLIEHIQEELRVHSELQEQAKLIVHMLTATEEQLRICSELLNNNRAQEQQLLQFKNLCTHLHTQRSALRQLNRTKKNNSATLSHEEQQNLLSQAQRFEQMRTQLAQAKEAHANTQIAHAQLIQNLSVRYHEQRAQLITLLQKKEHDLSLVMHEQKMVINALDQEKKMYQACVQELASLQISLDEMEIQNAQIEKKLERKKQFYLSFGARLNALTQALQALDHKISLNADMHNSACPLCEQMLSSSRKKLLHTKLAHEHSRLLHQKKRLAALIPALKQQLLDEHAQLTNAKKQHAEHRATDEKRKQYAEIITHKEKELASLTKRRDVAQQAVEQARTHVLELSSQDAFFAQDPAYQTSSQQLAVHEKTIAAIPYQAQEHERIQKIISTFESSAQAAHQAAEYRAQSQHHKQAILKCINELRIFKSDYGTPSKERAVLLSERAQVEKKIQVLEHEKNMLLQKKGATEQQIVSLAHKEKEVVVHQKKLEQQEALSSDYQVIAQALGKNGIQALLIETAIPELEQEANAILSKLTDNQSHIMIESVRDLKSGGLKETLDIKISDTVGTRPYELFSGGEAFRIDFALRIAISKLLARRSGTSLQTLIIDEGFGSQDEEGLARIMEALYKIQDDFAKIIIVSHLPEMKNQFPTHFFVQKHASGSQITVFEQG